MSAYSETTKRAISDGLKPSGRKMTDAQALAERCEAASIAGHSPSERRRILAEAAKFIREQYGLPPRAEERAA
jgi:hypothetical protein